MTPAARGRGPREPAAVDPIALIRIDTPVPHLDRPFDYLVPDDLDDEVRPGVRVRVRFSGRLMDGFVVERCAESTAAVALKPIERVVSPKQVLVPEVLALCEAVSDRYAGSVADVLRAAVPPRHAGAERRPMQAMRDSAGSAVPVSWSRYSGGDALLERLRAGQSVRAAWSLAPASDWAQDAAALLHACPGGAIAVLPDAADVDRLAKTLHALGLPCATLTADMGPERRYGAFLAALDGTARIVVGTRSAVFAPVRDLRLLLVWDDGDDSLREPHAPYWHAREVAAMRSHAAGCALVVGSPARSLPVQQLVDSGWMKSVAPARSFVRSQGPAVRAVDPQDVQRDHPGRMPTLAWTAAQRGLTAGPVLVQVPRAGYIPAMACGRCREPALCSCGGPFAQQQGSSAACRWCGRLSAAWACSCGSRSMRAASVGVERTAEEIGRAFPGARLVWSHGSSMRRSVPGEPAIVVATPGAEPRAEGGYAAVILLDAMAQIRRPSLDAGEQAVRRWFAAVALARPRAPVVVTAPSEVPEVQALTRWDAPWWAARELEERTAAGLPPAVRFVALEGPDADTAVVAAAIEGAIEGARVLGPVDGRIIAALPGGSGVDALRTIKSAAQRAKVTVRCDPGDL